MSETPGNRQEPEPEDTCAQLRFAASNSFSPTTVADTARRVIEQSLRATGHNTKWQTIQARKSIACSLEVRLQWLPWWLLLIFQDVHQRARECQEIRSGYLRTYPRVFRTECPLYRHGGSEQIPRAWRRTHLQVRPVIAR